MKRLSRSVLKKELRRNEIREALEYIRVSFRDRRENLVLAVIVLIVVLGGGYIYVGYQRSVKTEAATLWREGTNNFQAMLASGNDGLAGDQAKIYYRGAVDNFSKLSSGYGGEHLSGYARIYLGNSHFYAKEYVKAIDEYNNYLQEFPEGIYSGLAQKNIAICHRANGQLSEAARIFLDLLAKKPWGVSGSECKANLAAVYNQMGRKEEATKLRREILAAGEDKYWVLRDKAK